uniref:Uncharacterized protein n=1 Tax=Photorhabdus asymbiotica subsp. asymbiotica (strain ATCC 43949 / 3105-77) TaxID=553480 RepID=B6VL45_PHOAA|nr:Hypothetical protein PA-RVA6-3046 [Photorhabdus asymbiotica subsp. asymbiotica ATCC 43949]
MFYHQLLYPSSFKLLLCWLRSLAAALQIEIYWVYQNHQVDYVTA